MSLIGPIFPRKNTTSGGVPYVNTNNPAFSSSQEGEIITNVADGRLWLRKIVDFSNLPTSLFRYNFEQIGGPYVITEKTSGYTLQAQDSATIVEMNVSTPSFVWIPSFTGASGVNYTVGTEIKLLLTGASRITITGAAGVTINTMSGYALESQWGMATLIKRGTNSWVISGDLT
jgi:hypothetical protein